MARPGARGTGRALVAGGRVTTHAAVRAALAWSREVITVHATDDFDDAVALADHVDVVVVDVELLAEVGLYAAVSALRSAAAGPEVVAAAPRRTPPSSPRRCEAGARSFLVLGPDVRQARDTIEAALDGRGMLGVEAVAPLLDQHAALCGRERARDRAIVERLAAAVEAKDAVTSAHLRNVTRLAVALAAAIDPDVADRRGVRRRVPAPRRRQARRPRADPLQARPADRGRVGRHAPPPRDGRARRRPARALRDRRRRRPPPPRALGRRRLPGRAWPARRSRWPRGSSASATRWRR